MDQLQQRLCFRTGDSYELSPYRAENRRTHCAMAWARPDASSLLCSPTTSHSLTSRCCSSLTCLPAQRCGNRRAVAPQITTAGQHHLTPACPPPLLNLVLTRCKPQCGTGFIQSALLQGCLPAGAVTWIPSFLTTERLAVAAEQAVGATATPQTVQRWDLACGLSYGSSPDVVTNTGQRVALSFRAY